jgi:hypothetical protein
MRIPIFFTLLCFMAFAVTGCGAGGGSSDAPTPTPTPTTVVINGVFFNTSTSGDTASGLVTFPTAPFTSRQYNADGTLTSPQHLTADVASVAEVFAGVPATRLTLRNFQIESPTLTYTYTTNYWFAKASDGSVYMLKKTFTSNDPSSVAAFSIDFSAPGQSPFLVAPAVPTVGASYFWATIVSGSAPLSSTAGTIVNLSITSPSGVPGCIKLQRTDSTADAYVKPGIGYVEWMNYGDTHQVRTGLTGAG